MRIRLRLSLIILFGATLGWVDRAAAQSASLYGSPYARAPLMLDESSWMFQEIPEPPQIQINSLITVMVDEKARAFSQGDLQRRRNGNLMAILEDWIEFNGMDMQVAPQFNGDPTIGAQLASQFRAQNTLESRDNLQFRIQATVRDIRPNGTLVLEAHKTVRNNEEIWDYNLIGICRKEDILPNNTVSSEKIAELDIQKTERGQVRDGYKRSWLMKLLDAYSPF